MQGEHAHATGADGARRAKKWLEATTRVDVPWVNPNKAAREKLTFSWPGSDTSFSFDLGGILRHGDYDSESFFAEVKKYSDASDLPTHYSEFVAKCYVAYVDRQMYCDHFMWISWSPHSATTWSKLTTPEFVTEHVGKHRDRVFGPDAESTEVDPDIAKAVADRLWLFVLSDRQETLVIADKYLHQVNAMIREESA